MNLKWFVYAFHFNNIHNIDKPVCKDCKYFINDSVFVDEQYGRCAQFSYKNLISGKIYFQDVTKAREMCGVNGTLYQPKL